MKKITLFFLVIFGLGACGKFEDGPAISFVSVKNRVIGEWTLDKYIVDDKDSTEAYLQGGSEDFKFTKDYAVEYTAVGQDLVTGSWEIQDNLVLLKLNMKSPEGLSYVEQDTLNLTRLTNKEMWAISNNDVLRKFKSK